jgi:hypothetical protein
MTSKMKFPKTTPQLKRVSIIVLAGLGLMMLVLLAASLANLELEPAQPFFTLPERQEPVFDSSRIVDGFTKLSVGEALLLVGGFLILFVLLLAILPPEVRKRILRAVLRFGLLIWVILWAANRFRPSGSVEIESQQAAGVEQITPAVVTLPLYAPPSIPTWVSYCVTLVIILILGGVAYFIWRAVRPAKQPLRTLASAARSALKDISAGRDWDDTVIQCYARMSEAVSQQRGLFRQKAMTPSEFANHLEQAGLPSDPVRRLTRLFEKARYGGQKSGREEVNEAVTCLTAILHAVGEQP